MNTSEPDRMILNLCTMIKVFEAIEPILKWSVALPITISSCLGSQLLEVYLKSVTREISLYSGS